jgi:hypothetical protein
MEEAAGQNPPRVVALIEEEWKKLLRAARNRRILRMPTERMNECQQTQHLTLNLH